MFQLAADAIALELGEIIDVQLAVEMVDLVLDTLRQQPLAGELEGLAFSVQRLDGGLAVPLDLVVMPRHRQAALLDQLGGLGGNDLGIDHHNRRIFLGRAVHDGESQRDTDLGGCQSNARGVVHGLEHVVDQCLQVVVELFDRLADIAETRIWMVKNFQDCHAKLLATT